MNKNTIYKNNIPRGGCGGRDRPSTRESSKPNTFGAKKPFERRFREEKTIIIIQKEKERNEGV